MRITAKVALEVASHEGIVRQAYKDSVGVWTWSIGLAETGGWNVRQYINNPQPMTKCIDAWLTALERYAEDVRKALAGRPITEAQFAAALSFHFNTGAIKRATWVKQWKAGEDAKARRSIMNWTKAGGKRNKGLTARRQKERDLFFDGRWSNDGTTLEYTAVDGNHRPMSPKRVSIRAEVQSIMRGESMPGAPKPDVEPVTAPKRPDKRKGWLAGLTAVTAGGGSVAVTEGAPWEYIAAGVFVAVIVGLIVWRKWR